MTKKKVLVLGASGMLGSAVLRAFAASSGFETVATVRGSASLPHFTPALQALIVTGVDVLHDDSLVSLLQRVRPDVVVNCVGLIKQFSSSKDPLVALPINAIFPHKLARLCGLSGARLVHISTDCVFSGSTGNYLEEDIADAHDLYGVSKRLGEVVDYQHAVTLRTSIIGRELESSNSLIDWFLAKTGSVNGFTKAIFSGLPTCELASVIRDLVVPNMALSGLFHVSAAPIAKSDLLAMVAAQYGKEIEIVPDATLVIDRSLNSSKFTTASGYVAPDWPELVRRMHSSDPHGEN